MEIYEKAKKQEGLWVKMIGDKLWLRNELYSLSELIEDRSIKHKFPVFVFLTLSLIVDGLSKESHQMSKELSFVNDSIIPLK